MAHSTVRRGVTLFLVLVCSILVANMLTNVLVGALGLAGISGFIAGFIVYAVVFFGILYLFERFLGVTIFYFHRK